MDGIPEVAGLDGDRHCGCWVGWLVGWKVVDSG